MEIKKFNYRKLFYNNKFVAIFSLLLSFGIWIKISSGSSETTNKTINNIPISIELSKEAKENGLSIFGIEDTTCEITVSGNRIILGQLSKDDIQVYSQQSEGLINKTGNYTLELKAKKVGILKDYEFESNVYPKFVNVFVDRFKSKEFNITSNITYSTDPKYFSPVSLSENSVIISGPDSIVSNISKVCVEKEIPDPITQTTNIKGLKLQLYDNSNQKMSSKYLNYSTEEIDATISLLNKKNVPFSLTYANAPLNLHFKDSFIKVTPNFIDIAAPANVINSINKIEIEPLDFSKVNLSNNSFDLPLKMPSECRNLSNTYSANVKINMNGILSKKINIDNITFINVPQGKQAKSSTLNLKVEVLGPESEIKKISSEDILAQVDLASKEGFTGTTEVPAKIIFKNSKPNCWAYGNYNINTEIK